MPEVSVIIPAFKPDHLLEALASVWTQSFTDYEVIVVNDGSPFEIRQPLLPLIEAGRLRYIEQDNKGVAAARNRGLREAVGEFIAFLDDDDYWPADKLDWQIKFLRQHADIAVIGGTVQLVDEEGRAYRPPVIKEGRLGFEDLFNGCPYRSPGQTLVRSSIFELVGLFDESIWGADDFDFWLRVAKRAGIQRHANLALFYRMHGSNAHRDALRMCLNCQRVLETHLGALPSGDRHRLAPRAYRWLYDYAGQRVINDCKKHLRAGSADSFAGSCKAIARFVRGARLDRDLLCQIGRDLLPARFFARRG